MMVGTGGASYGTHERYIKRQISQISVSISPHRLPHRDSDFTVPTTAGIVTVRNGTRTESQAMIKQQCSLKNNDKHFLQLNKQVFQNVNISDMSR